MMTNGWKRKNKPPRPMLSTTGCHCSTYLDFSAIDDDQDEGEKCDEGDGDGDYDDNQEGHVG